MGLKTNSTQMLSVTLIASLLMSGTAAFTTGAGLCDVPADVAALVATGAGTSMDWASADGGTGSVVAAAATVAAGEKALIKVMGTAVSGFLVHVNNAAARKQAFSMKPTKRLCQRRVVQASHATLFLTA